MRRILALLSLIFITHLPMSCNCGLNSCGCGDDFKRQTSTIKSLKASIGEYITYFTNKTPKDTLNSQSAAIKIEISETEYKSANLEKANFSFISEAMACSPPEPTPIQKISSIQITSEKPISSSNKEFKTGQTLNELFYIANANCPSSKCEINDFIQLQNKTLGLFGYSGSYLIFMLKNKPDSMIHQAFEFEFVLSDTSGININTSKIIVK